MSSIGAQRLRIRERKERAERILRARLSAEMTANELKRLIGVSAPTLRRFEHGESEPSFTNLVDIARETGTNLAWLLFGDVIPQGFVREVERASKRVI